MQPFQSGPFQTHGSTGNPYGSMAASAVRPGMPGSAMSSMAASAPYPGLPGSAMSLPPSWPQGPMLGSMGPMASAIMPGSQVGYPTMPPGALASMAAPPPSVPGRYPPPPGSGPLLSGPLGPPIFEPPQQQEEHAEPIIPVWYPAENNWHACIEKMAMDYHAVQNEFSGAWSDQQRDLAETKREKAADFMNKQTGGRVGREYKQKTRTAHVVDIFQDENFPPDSKSWYMGGDPRDFHELKPPGMWKRLQEFSLDTPYPVVDAMAGSFNPHGGRIYQGALEDFYLIAGMQIVGMKPKLIADIFANMEFSNPRLGLFTLRLYKHGQWHDVQIDDALPFDRSFNPLCCSGENWPDLAWPSLIEKAYAKMHGSWEGLGGGGHVEEVLTDLTGGCACRFGTTDVAADRLWQYLFEMMPSCVFGCNINEAEFSKRNIPIEQHWAASIWSLEKHHDVPYICVCLAAPSGTLRHMPVCDVPSADGYGLGDGFVWLRIDDFICLFDTVYECRLYNTDLGPLTVGGIPCSPGWVTGYSWFEEMWAFQGHVYSETAPSFLIEVLEAPNMITLEVSQTDIRYSEQNEEKERGRGMQAPLLLRFYQCSREVSDQGGGEIYLVHLSPWGHARDACCGVKVMRPGKYLAMVSMPARYTCNKMIFRSYSTKPLAMKPIVTHRSWISVNPAMPLDAMPYSLGGFQRVDALSERLPQMFDGAGGRGKPMANGLDGNISGANSRRNHHASALEQRLGSMMGGNKDNMGLKIIGKFGGRDAVASMDASEQQDACCIA
mmetsp:Transcript_60947/g.197218  ORF Transcript_60947/g.197218 Transcript_60947/m.197218 type:complete len:777 (+) Transcript_60947:104-2434(+)